MTAKRFLPPDVSSDIHQIIAKAIYLRLANGNHDDITLRESAVFTREELQRAADTEFEYDFLDGGELLFRPVVDPALADTPFLVGSH